MSGPRNRCQGSDRPTVSEGVYRALLSAAFSKREREALDRTMDYYRELWEDARTEGWTSLVRLRIEMLHDLVQVAVKDRIAGYGIRRLSGWEVLLVFAFCFFWVYSVTVLVSGLLSLSMGLMYIYDGLSRGSIWLGVYQFSALAVSLLAGIYCIAVASRLWTLSLRIRSELRAARSC